MVPPVRDYYEVLGVDEDASQAQIKTAYKKKALRLHPDAAARSGENVTPEAASKRFQELQAAYEVLSDVDKREEYDMYGDVDGDDYDDHMHGHGMGMDSFMMHMMAEMMGGGFGSMFYDYDDEYDSDEIPYGFYGEDDDSYDEEDYDEEHTGWEDVPARSRDKLKAEIASSSHPAADLFETRYVTEDDDAPMCAHAERDAPMFSAFSADVFCGAFLSDPAWGAMFDSQSGKCSECEGLHTVFEGWTAKLKHIEDCHMDDVVDARVKDVFYHKVPNKSKNQKKKEKEKAKKEAKRREEEQKNKEEEQKKKEKEEEQRKKKQKEEEEQKKKQEEEEEEKKRQAEAEALKQRIIQEAEQERAKEIADAKKQIHAAEQMIIQAHWTLKRLGEPIPPSTITIPTTTPTTTASSSNDAATFKFFSGSSSSATVPQAAAQESPIAPEDGKAFNFSVSGSKTSPMGSKGKGKGKGKGRGSPVRRGF